MRKRVYSVKRRVSRPPRSTDSHPIMGRGKVTSRPPPSGSGSPALLRRKPALPRPPSTSFGAPRSSPARAIKRQKSAKLPRESRPRAPPPRPRDATRQNDDSRNSLRGFIKQMTQKWRQHTTLAATKEWRQRALSSRRRQNSGACHTRAHAPALYSTSHMYTTDGKVEKTLAKCT